MTNADKILTGDDGGDAVAGWGMATAVLAALLLELLLLQGFAVGATTAIYHLAPLLEAGQPQGFDDWIDIFQVVGPMLTLPGGAVIVLSTWLMTRWVRRTERRAAAAEAAAAEARANVAAAVAAAVAEAQANAAAAVAEAQANALAAEEKRAAAAEAVAALQAEVERLRAQN